MGEPDGSAEGRSARRCGAEEGTQREIEASHKSDHFLREEEGGSKVMLKSKRRYLSRPSTRFARFHTKCAPKYRGEGRPLQGVGEARQLLRYASRPLLWAFLGEGRDDRTFAAI